MVRYQQGVGSPCDDGECDGLLTSCVEGTCRVSRTKVAVGVVGVGALLVIASEDGERVMPPFGI